jgi:hypothetical protein
MRFYARLSLPALLAGAIVAVSAAAAQASFGVTEDNFEAETCLLNSCTYESVAKTPSEAFTQAAGHTPWGVTTFELNHKKGLLAEEPEGALKRIRVDVPAGLAADPEALPKCKRTEFDANACAADTQVGTTELTVYDGVNDLTVAGEVYNLEQPEGLPLFFGIDTGVEPLVNVHIFLEGHVAWSSDYHEYFEINNVPKEGELGGMKVPLTVLKSKLNFNGHAGAGDFLTLSSVCSNSTTSHLEVESYAGEISKTETHTPAGVEGCDKVPFKPTAVALPESAQSDTPDGVTTELEVPQNVGPLAISMADVKDVHLTLPEGMTLNPSAARGLEACTAAQIGIGTTNPVTCPAASRVGGVTIETDLPPGSLAGNVYLGNPSGGPITGPPYTIYLDAESIYGVSVRLQGSVNPNPSTGRLEATFTNNPQLPFSALLLTLKGGAQAPLANPLGCETGNVEALFTPYTGLVAVLSSTPFATTGCPSPLPFSLTQSTQNTSANAGAYTSYTFNLGRADGQQYLSQVTTILPPGLVGLIPSVTPCGEPQAQAGTCSSSSEIGQATVNVGAGPEPYAFSGPVFLTGPYDGAPYGLSIPVDAVAGPFNLGTVVTRATINVDPTTAQVIASSALPTIVKGIPLRLKGLSVAVNRPRFLLNPTDCGVLASEYTLTSTFAVTQSLSSPFEVANCSALAFKPSFKASTSGKASKANGASLETTINQPAGEANIKSVLIQLPTQLPSRLSTLQKACLQATFAANPYSCPAGSLVGSARANTPVLPGKMTGPVYLVSHGGAAFPDTDLVLEANSVRVIVVGNTNITKGITTTNFATTPDVPVTSITVNLPLGPHSALTANVPEKDDFSLCGQSLSMPTVITGQNGKQLKQNTKLAVSGCGVRIVGYKVVRHTLVLTVQAFAAGRISANGRSLNATSRRLRKATTTTLKVSLSRAGLTALRTRRKLKIHVRVGFLPKNKGEASSVASSAVTFR